MAVRKATAGPKDGGNGGREKRKTPLAGWRVSVYSSPVMNLYRLLVGTAALSACGTVFANSSFFVAPSFRGANGGAYSTYTGWESFTVAVGAPGNLGDLAGSSTAAVLIQTDPLAAVLGSGNLYNQNGKSVFEVQYNNAGALPIDQVVFQMRTAGNELDYSSVTLSYSGGTLSGTRTELERTSFGGPPGTPGSGFSVSSSYHFDLPNDYTGSFTVSFKSADVSVSFDAAALDVGFVPEPSTWALLGLGAGALVIAGRNRRR